MITRRAAGTPMANSNKKGPGKPQQTTSNRNAVQNRPETTARSAAKVHGHRTSTPAPTGRRKTGGSSQYPATRIHAPAAPIDMDDESDPEMPATENQERNSPAVTNRHKQAQASKVSTSLYRSSQGRCIVPDDEEEEVIEEDKSDQENEEEDDIYGDVNSTALVDEQALFDDDIPDLCRHQSVSSLGLDEIPPSSEGNENEGELEYEDDSEAQAGAPPKKKTRTDLRREEVPTWKETPEPDFSENELATRRETTLATSQKRKRHHEPGHNLSVSKEFPEASYCRPLASQTLAIKDQPEKMRIVLRSAVRQVTRHAIAKGTYIEMTKTHSTLCKIFMETARGLKQNAFAERMKADVVFQRDVAAMLSNRLSGFRSNIKNAVSVGMVRGWYHLDGPDGKAKAGDLILQEKYIFPPSNTGPDFVDKTKPYLHAAIISILQDNFFTADRGACLVEQHADCFKSSIPERSGEVEVTAPMAAFAATCIHATLKQINSESNRRGQKFNSDRFESVYDTHITYLNSIRSTSLPKYHRLMSDLHRAASSGTQVNPSNLGQAGIDIDGMLE